MRGLEDVIRRAFFRRMAIAALACGMLDLERFLPRSPLDQLATDLAGFVNPPIGESIAALRAGLARPMYVFDTLADGA